MGIAASAEPTEAEKRAAALGAIRETAAARGNLDAINAKIAEARKLQGEPAYDKELARLEELTTYALRVWEHIENVLKNITNIPEMKIGDQIVAPVDYLGGTLIIRIAGQNREYTKKNMPGKLALALAQQEMTPDNPGNKVHFGAMLVLDAKGDKKLAKQMWDEAAKAGVDVTRLLPELDVPPIPVPAQVPAMNVVLRNMLSDKNWLLRRKPTKAWTKANNGDIVTQNDDGRLVGRVPTSETGPVQIVTKRPISGDFTCRMIVQSAGKGNAIALFAADGDDAGFTAPLPVGTFLVEITRAQGKVTFQIGEQEATATAIGMLGPRTPCAVGLLMPPGGEATIAAIEFVAK
ncbi:MAG: hypothetical protein SFU86_18345 [Pirellulaceae bacterium]|nr:hypothetical protein [Pirellulaceae bacterium]